MGWQDRAIPVTGSWQDGATPQDEPKNVSALESAVRGAAMGSSLGFADELTGAAEAAKDKLEGSDKDFSNLYRQHRDESRANYDAAEKAHPYISAAGQLAGGLATGWVPGLGEAEGATALAKIAKAAALGGTYGLGASDADLTKGDVAGAAKDTAEGAALGGVLQPLGEKVIAPLIQKGAGAVSDLAGYAGKKVLNAGLGLPEGVTSRYLAPGGADAINSAKSLPEIAQNLPETLSHVREETGPLAEKAAASLSSERIPGKGVPVQDVLDTLGDILQNSSDPSQLGVVQQARNKVLTDYQSRMGQIGEAHPNLMTEQELKPVIKTLQDAGAWNTPILTSDKAAVNSASGKLNGILKGQNPDFAQAQADLAQQTQVKNALIKKFGLERDFSNPNSYTDTDRTQTALKQLPNDNRVDRSRVADQLNNLGYGDLGTQVQNASDKAAFTRSDVNGSRRTTPGTIVGGAVGAGVGSLIGHPFIGAQVGGAVGAGVSGVIDKYGLKMSKQILDSKIFTENQLRRIGNSPFGKTIGDAAKRGNHALATTQFILGQTNPEFRKLTQDDDDGNQ